MIKLLFLGKDYFVDLNGSINYTVWAVVRLQD
jgi:hypothetical protein